MPAKKWTKQRVIDAIRERQRQGLPMNTVWREDGALNCAAKVHFGGWRKALLAAGEPGARPHERWPRRRVVDGILSRYRAGNLNKTWKEDRRLYAAAFDRFGSWQQALVAAGVKKEYVPPRTWTKQAVIDAIRERHRRADLQGSCRNDPQPGMIFR